MAHLNWRRVPRTGFIPSHWVATTATGKDLFRVEKRVIGGRRNKSIDTLAWRLPSGGCDTYSSLKVAKAACDNIARLANYPEV